MAADGGGNDVTRIQDDQKSLDATDDPRERKLTFNDDVQENVDTVEEGQIVPSKTDDVNVGINPGLQEEEPGDSEVFDDDVEKGCNGNQKMNFDDDGATSMDDITNEHLDKRGCCKKSKVLKELCFHLGPLGFLIAYCLLGAFVMKILESGHELDVLTIRKKYQENVVKDLVNVTSNPPANENISELILGVIKGYERNMYEIYREGVTDPSKIKWSYKAALFFTATVVSTVGYGHITPVTIGGRLFCMFFAFFGIPIMLLSVTRCGQGLAKLVQISITACKRKCDLKSPCLAERGDKKFTIPAYIAIIFLVFYMLFGALLFRLWETWSMLEAFYFCFITMTTIGFGDIIPAHPNFMLLCTLYLILGLAITSMCLELAEYEYVKRMKTVRRTFKRVQRFTGTVHLKSRSQQSLESASGKEKSTNSNDDNKDGGSRETSREHLERCDSANDSSAL